MPTTTTLFPDSPLGYAFAINGFGGENGFEYSGHHYTVLVNNGDDVINSAMRYRVFEDATTILDAAGSPTPSNHPTPAWCVARDGATIFVIETFSTGVYGTDGTEFNIHVYTFDLVSKTWTSGPTTFAIPVRSQYRGGTTLPTGGEDQCNLKLVVRGTNDYILMYSGPLDHTGGRHLARQYYVTFDGSTFGTPVMLPIQTSGTFVGNSPFGFSGPYYLGAGSIGLDSAGRCYFFAQNNQYGGNGQSIVLWTLTSGNVLSAAQLVNDPLDGLYYSDVQGQVSNALVYTPTGGETIAIAGEFYEGTGTSCTQRVYYASVGDTPTFAYTVAIAGNDTQGSGSGGGYANATNTDMPTSDNSDWNTQTMALVYDATAAQVMLVWCATVGDGPTGNSQGHFVARTSPGNSWSWSGTTELFASPPMRWINNRSQIATAAGMVHAYSTSTGVAVIGCSLNESAQFWISSSRKNNYCSAGGPMVGRGSYASC